MNNRIFFFSLFFAAIHCNSQITDIKLSDEVKLDRVYLGFEKDQEELAATLQFYESKKVELLAVIDNFKLLPARERKEMKAYLNSFFDENHTIHFGNDKLSFNSLD